MTPLYVQLMEEVEKSIRSGEYKPGDRLMTEAEMAKKYGVSLITVRKAIGSLTEKGLVVRKQGKGTFVVRPKLFRNMKKLQSLKVKPSLPLQTQARRILRPEINSKMK